MPRDEAKRFVNFPLVLLAETITSPEAGMIRLGSFAMVDYADRFCQPTEAEAIVQLAYAARRRERLPAALQRAAARDSFAEYVASLDEAWVGNGAGTDFIENAIDLLGNRRELLDDAEAEAAVVWCGTRRAVRFFAEHFTFKSSYETLRDRFTDMQRLVDNHQRAHGALCLASVPVDYFKQAGLSAGDPDAMRLFRMVCAVRSLVGKKPFVGTTKNMIRARMIGAKSPAVARALTADSEPLREELDAMGSRKRFDRLMEECTRREFFCRVTLTGGRRMNLSTTVMHPGKLKALVSNCIRKGARGGTPGGDTRGDTINKSYLISLRNKGRAIGEYTDSGALPFPSNSSEDSTP
jgi:hypothetical protein